MPDTHWGMGATIGSVIATKGAIIPAAVGVDIGCGMVASKTNLRAGDLPDSLTALRSAVEAAVPHGRTNNGREGDRGAWHSVPERVMTAWSRLMIEFQSIQEEHPTLRRGNSVNHLGTLGTGNHFIELCLDEDQNVWVMLHSGSRGVGNRIGTYFIEQAKIAMRRYFINLPDEDLAYIPDNTEAFGQYWRAVKWCQEFASANRQCMLAAVYEALAKGLGRDVCEIDTAINCHHNYVAKETHYGEEVWITRKGAVYAGAGALGIIPGSMGARSYISRGLGNPESFNSSSHGAGRIMSRSEAKRRVSLEEHVAACSGVECRLDADVIDETPAAYKNIDAVMTAQADLVEIVHTLKQVLCVKG
jgi:tRNA-splicing ligase RtcB